MNTHVPFPLPGADERPEETDLSLYELVFHLRKNRPRLRSEWLRSVSKARLLEAIGPELTAQTADMVYDGYVNALANDGLEGLRNFLRKLPDTLQARGIGHRDALGLVYSLRDVLGQSFFRKFRLDSVPGNEALPRAV